MSALAVRYDRTRAILEREANDLIPLVPALIGPVQESRPRGWKVGHLFDRLVLAGQATQRTEWKVDREDLR
jgi:hypothetical protein